MAIIPAGQDYTFSFAGICEDCALQPDGSYGIRPAFATLTVTDYVLGDSLDGHVTGFTYTSDLLGTFSPWNQASFTFVTGSIDSLSPSVQAVDLRFYDQREHQFLMFATASQAEGAWGIGTQVYLYDYGNSHTWSGVPTQPVPEAETYAMMLAGLGLLGVAAKRRKAGKQ